VSRLTGIRIWTVEGKVFQEAVVADFRKKKNSEEIKKDEGKPQVRQPAPITIIEPTMTRADGRCPKFFTVLIYMAIMRDYAKYSRSVDRNTIWFFAYWIQRKYPERAEMYWKRVYSAVPSLLSPLNISWDYPLLHVNEIMTRSLLFLIDHFLMALPIEISSLSVKPSLFKRNPSMGNINFSHYYDIILLFPCSSRWPRVF
jgi:hypothetical protein